MLRIDDAWKRTDLPRGTVGTIGNFDGLHRGQRAILGRVVERAAATGLRSAVVTFDPHPLSVLRPQGAPRRLLPAGRKSALLEAAGLDLLIVVRFTPEFSRTPAREFVLDFLHRRLGMREIYVGRRFAFGRDRQGNLELLRELAAEAGFRAEGVDEVLHGGEPISSTRIRESVGAGEMEEAMAMLGRPYALSGVVVPGDGRGRELGWPTANLEIENELLPADGVYAGRIRLSEAEESRPAVSNVGVRPTFDGRSDRVVESHVLDFEGDLYGSRVELELWKRLRGERRFPSVEELCAQIGRDAAATREYFAARTCCRNGADLGAETGVEDLEVGSVKSGREESYGQ